MKRKTTNWAVRKDSIENTAQKCDT